MVVAEVELVSVYHEEIIKLIELAVNNCLIFLNFNLKGCDKYMALKHGYVDRVWLYSNLKTEKLTEFVAIPLDWHCALKLSTTMLTHQQKKLMIQLV